MKRILFLLAVLFAASSVNAQKKHEDCKITKSYGMMSETFRLTGRVKIVTDPNEFATFRVRVTKNPGEASLYVKVVKELSNPTCDCGEWRFVEKDEYFSIRLVDDFEDFVICFVESNPGSRY